MQKSDLVINFNRNPLQFSVRVAMRPRSRHAAGISIGDAGGGGEGCVERRRRALHDRVAIRVRIDGSRGCGNIQLRFRLIEEVEIARDGVCALDPDVGEIGRNRLRIPAFAPSKKRRPKAPF